MTPAMPISAHLHPPSPASETAVLPPTPTDFIRLNPLQNPPFCRRSHKKTGISRKTERRPARTNGLYLKQLRCDSSLCRYEKTIRPKPCRAYQPIFKAARSSKRHKKAPVRGETSVPLLKAVAAGAVLAVAGIAHMDGLQLAVAAVHIELALRNAARNAAVDHITIHISPPHKVNMRKSAKIIPNPVDKAPVLW